MFKLNLQFFAEGENNGNDDSNNNDNAGTTGDNNGGNSEGSEGDNTIDVTALAELISEQDKRIQQLEQDNKNLKTTNTKLLMRVNADNGAGTKPKSFDENLLDMVGFKPRKG